MKKLILAAAVAGAVLLSSAAQAQTTPEGYQLQQVLMMSRHNLRAPFLMRWWCKSPKPGQSKTWVLFGKTNHGKLSGEILYWLVGQGKKLFRWRLPEGNPYLRTETRNTYTSRFTEVAMAFASI